MNSSTSINHLPPPHPLPHPHPAARLRSPRPHRPQFLAVPRRWSAITWPRAGLIALLVLTAAAYLWDLSASGYANSFYAAAVQAATKSWEAFFFGSINPSNFITVDKPPASLWVMALSGRLFGFSSWSMLIPQALEGVAAVALLHTTVMRWFGAGAGLAAGALLATTPVAALMFRFNNPDALLVLLLVAAAYCLTRALERAGTRWVLAAGTTIGFAFLAKMMQAFLVVPAFGLVYLIAAPTGIRRRLWQLAAGAGAIALSAGWWVAIVALWPAGSRPMIDGSSRNSILDLITGYNGLGRIFGASGPGGGGSGFGGSPGLLRLFNSLMGGQASWLLPASLLALTLGLWWTRRAPRTDRARAALVLWGGWLIVSGLVFSLSSGIIHTYYTVALAPAIAALVAIGGRLVWEHRESLAARIVTAVAVIITAGWSWILLDRTPHWHPWISALVVVAAAGCVLVLIAVTVRRPLARRLVVPMVVLGLVASLAGPVAYAADTVTTAHAGSVPSAGPAVSGGFGGGAGFGGSRPAASASRSGSARSGTTGTLPSGTTGTAPSGTTGTAPSGTTGTAPSGTTGTAPSGTTGARPSGMAGGFGGRASSVSAALVQALKANAGRYPWVAATSGSQSAASLELATGGDAVMAIGGFSHEGGNLSLAQFEQYVNSGLIHYYIASGGGGGGPGGGSSTSQITSWVKSHYKAVTIGGEKLYDLTQPRSTKRDLRRATGATVGE